MAELLHRFAKALVQETLEDTPIAVIQGARQVGKSTLARAITNSRPSLMLSLDTQAVFQAAIADPDSFVRQTSDLLVIDEVQRAPQLILAMKDAIEEDRRPGRFLITGSANLLELPGTEESLAGRAETVVLYGLSRGEINGHREDFVDRLLSGDEDDLKVRRSDLERGDYLEMICAGSYQEPLGRSGRRRNAWFDNYLNRIVTRDAHEVSRLQHIDRLPALVRLLAANNAGELAKTRLAQDAGIPPGSVDAYIHLLETLYLVHVLPAWGNNLTSRVVKSPKAALLDTGLAARLLNVTPGAMAAPERGSTVAGAMFEAFVAGEIRRQLVWAETDAQLFHFRDRNGIEVDLVLEDGRRNVAGIEIKAARTVARSEFRGLEALRDKLGDRFRLGVLLYTGNQPLPFGDRLWALPLESLWS
ncbi:MAG TPA: ATP-binding protein [Nocardioides sp.]|nr:ATP-binding protein [Nocardioides sp.]HRI95746.1 ATP-binding protein [Nocardioides sp.]HRK45844.1 ATP-binding protein [Nocardioides sp.]